MNTVYKDNITVEEKAKALALAYLGDESTLLVDIACLQYPQFSGLAYLPSEYFDQIIYITRNLIDVRMHNMHLYSITENFIDKYFDSMILRNKKLSSMFP